jgi:hypothetical protein
MNGAAVTPLRFRNGYSTLSRKRNSRPMVKDVPEIMRDAYRELTNAEA